MLEFPSPKEGSILEINSSHQSNQSSEINDPLTPFICSICEVTQW